MKRVAYCLLALAPLCGAQTGNGQTGDLKGRVGNNCGSNGAGLRVFAAAPDVGVLSYPARITDNGEFEFWPLVLNGDHKYNVFIAPGQGFRFDKTQGGPVRAGRTTTIIENNPCIVNALNSVERPYVYPGALQSAILYLVDPENSSGTDQAPEQTASPSTDTDKYTFFVKRSTAGADQRASRTLSFWANRSSVTIFGLDNQNRAIFLDKLAPHDDGSIDIEPGKYASYPYYLLSFRKPGFDAKLEIVRSLVDPISPVEIARSDNRTIMAQDVADSVRGRPFSVWDIAHLPISGNRSVDTLALLNSGVTPAPMAGTATGPGISPNLGSAGEVVVNGIRPRMNNFVTDGADNNDEAVGVRRQGFVFPGPYVPESIREFQALTALYDARYGRASGGQFNVLTRLGEDTIHGNIYGYWTGSPVNSRNFFNGDYSRHPTPASVYLDPNGALHQSEYSAGGNDPYQDGAAGLILSFPAGHSTFVSLSAEGRRVAAHGTHHFAVPTIAERGLAGTGTGRLLFAGTPIAPTSRTGDAVFSLFPFPNNIQGPYGANTFTKVLPADRQGALYSLRVDRGFDAKGWNCHASFAFSGTTESSTLPVTGGALYSTLSPNVHTYSETLFLDSSHGNSANSLRVSLGAANFGFGRVRDPLLLPSSFGADPFLLNQTLQQNISALTPGRGMATYLTNGTTESMTGPVGEINVAGYSGLGVDVFRFPQVRRDSTVHLSEGLSTFFRDWTLVGGVDVWRFLFDSRAERNSRPYLQFNGSIGGSDPNFSPSLPFGLIQPSDAVAAGLPAVDMATVSAQPSNKLNLHRTQIDLFLNATRQLRSTVSLTIGLRVEGNRLPKSSDGRFESAFDQNKFSSQIAQNLSVCANDNECTTRVSNLNAAFLGNYSSVFSANQITWDPRLGIAWDIAGHGRNVLRAGTGKYTTQFPAIILEESRSVFPLSFPLNFSGVPSFTVTGMPGFYSQIPTETQLAPLEAMQQSSSETDPVKFLSRTFSGTLINTRPADHLHNPYVLHYGLTLEHMFSNHANVSLSYVGTKGSHLLRMLAPSGIGTSYGGIGMGSGRWSGNLGGNVSSCIGTCQQV